MTMRHLLCRKWLLQYTWILSHTVNIKFLWIKCLNPVYKKVSVTLLLNLVALSPILPIYAKLAQMVGCWTDNRRFMGSNPPRAIWTWFNWQIKVASAKLHLYSPGSWECSGMNKPNDHEYLVYCPLSRITGYWTLNIHILLYLFMYNVSATMPSIL